MGVYPEQKSALAESADVERLAELLLGREHSIFWSCETSGSEAGTILTRLGYGMSIGLPLNIGAARVGVILLLGLPDKHSISQIMHLLDILSTVVALVFRNSQYQEHLEEVVKERTADLKTAVETLRTSRIAALNIMEDVIQAKDALKEREEHLKTSLREKEVLLKEIHHRVKNNLQIISSMLNLQLPYLKDGQAVDLFKESQNRVHSMALIHEKLYQSESLAKIDLPEYIRSLTASLFLSYGVSERSIRPKISVEDISVDIDTVVPCALIINELVSNSLKHAFPDSWRQAGRIGEISIQLGQHAGDELALTVSDNGIGLPPGFAMEKGESLGLKIVNVLVRQLRGTIQHGTDNAAEFKIRFRRFKNKEFGHKGAGAKLKEGT
ncbi:MAG: histidine kinase dimerization/phosphoacceptor domain -containing protein [Thermodesulfobacteriota bacterium]